MKSVLKNSVLVFLLAFLLMAPYMSFGLFGVQEQNQQSVLGVDTSVRPSSSLNKSVQSKNLTVIDQVDLNLNLSDQSVQKFYDVIPESLIDPRYEYIVVYSKEIKNQGVEIIQIVNDLSVDLGVYTKASMIKTIPVSILVVER